MPQLHFTVDEKTAKRLARDAQRHGVSLSKYLARLVTAEEAQSWPKGYLATVVGSCSAAPLVVPDELPLDDVDWADG